MSTSSKLIFLACAALGASAQQPNRLSTRSMLHITMPDDAPLTVLQADWGESVATPRGSAILLDLRTSLTLRNTGSKAIRGVTLLVMAQEVAPGGKASVSVPNLNVTSGEAFPVRLDLSLLRPVDSSDGPLVEVSLDGIIFDDLSFYGPNRLNSRRTMAQWEMEARRDRRFLKSLFDRAGAEGIRQHMVQTVARLSDRPKWDVQLARGRATAAEPEHALRFAFLDMPGEPVHAVNGTAQVSGSGVRNPQIEVQSNSHQKIRYLEIGWILSDSAGNQVYAGAVPADVNLNGFGRAQIKQDASLKLTQRAGRPASITGMTGFVNHVEFADGMLWIPDRAGMEALPKGLQPSAEEQRLADLYRKRGLKFVLDEIRKY